MEKISEITQRYMQRLKEIAETYKFQPEPRYDCPWCRDSGMVGCYEENGVYHPFRFSDRVRMFREKTSYFAVAPCGFCEAGTYRGRPTDGSLRSAERWVRENVTTVVSLRGTYEKAEEEGFSKLVIDQAFQRLGIRKLKLAGKWVCEPV